MRRLVVLCMAVTLAVTISSCREEVCSFPEESLSGIRGRLWVNPNPIRFPVVEPDDSSILLVDMIFSNIGSEDVTIESIDFSGDSEFKFPSKDFFDQMCPAEFSGFEECDRVCPPAF